MKNNTTKCPVCGVMYLSHALNLHLSQMAGKEAQYELARLFYKAVEHDKIALVVNTQEGVMENCPHWKYVLENKKKLLKRPVEN